MSALEVLAYAPEHRPTVRLPLVAVPPERWWCTGAGLPPVLPVHPWQYEHVLGVYPGLRDTGRRLAARPLMSLRTVAPLDEPGCHLKTAVDVQMTSAVRTVSPAAVGNGPPVTAFLAGLAGRVGLDGPAGGLAVLRETAAGAVLVDGAPCRSLAVVVRQAPSVGPGEVVLPLATLAAPVAAGGAPVVAGVVAAGYRGDPVAFVADLAGLLLRATLALLCVGVALEAHGQNTLVVLRGGRPVRLLYRDVGGVRISPARLRGHGLSAPPLRGDLAQDDPQVLRDTLFGALGTVLGEQVAVLQRAHQVESGRLWAGVSGAARAVAGELSGDAAADVAALFGATWPVKATTAMRLADDPLRVVWVRQPNPLLGVA
jgi:siderophore synthetase component